MISYTVFSGAEGMAQFFTVLIIFIFVLFLAIITTRFAGNMQKGQMTNRNFKVIETFRVAPNKFLQIIKIGEKFVVIAVSKDNVTRICELDEEELEIPEESETDFAKTSKEAFSKIYENMKRQITSRKK